MQLTFAAGSLGAVKPLKACPALVARAHPRRLSSAPKPRSGYATLVRAVASEQATNGADPESCEAEVVVKIDNQHDPFSTIVQIEFGSILGELLDTVAALKGLGLNIKRAQVSSKDECGTKVHKFFVTDARTSEKVTKSAKIEEIRLTILSNMLEFHPEAGERLAWGSDTARSTVVRDTDATHPLGAKPGALITQVEVRPSEDSPFTQLLVNTLDRPGLLTDIVSILKDINLNVVSAEVDTIGRNAVDTFNVTYHGEPLNASMCQLAVNCLQYYLSKGEVEKDYTESY